MEIEELPVLKLFMHNLSVYEGGRRKSRVCKDHVRRVGRLLYEVDSEPKGVKKLWQLLPMKTIRNNFFEGNDLLPQQYRRKPQTLKTHIVTYRMFLKFVLASEQSIRLLEKLDDDDVSQVRDYKI